MPVLGTGRPCYSAVVRWCSILYIIPHIILSVLGTGRPFPHGLVGDRVPVVGVPRRVLGFGPTDDGGADNAGAGAAVGGRSSGNAEASPLALPRTTVRVSG